MVFTRRAGFASIALALLLGGAARADNKSGPADSQTADGARVTRSPAVSTTRWYDAQDPPTGLPVDPAEAGLTVSQFRCKSEVTGTVVEHSRRNNGVSATVRITGVSVQLGLAIDEWIATPPSRGIVAHEDGHRIISEHFYARADVPALEIARKTVGKTFTAAGADLSTAMSNALGDAAASIGPQYNARVYAPCNQAQEAYDKITAHGTNDVDEMDAIESALKQVKQP
jgi:hypothetical protein